MSDWANWLEQYTERMQVDGTLPPKALQRMYLEYGRSTNKDEICGQCQQFHQNRIGKFFKYQCAKAGLTRHDWRPEWPACGIFQLAESLQRKKELRSR